MYRAGRHSARERIIAAEVMKLERRQRSRMDQGPPRVRGVNGLPAPRRPA